MTWDRIESIDDLRLDAYRDLRNRNWTQYSRRFIAESRLLVKRLLASNYRIESILVDEKQIDDARQWIPADSPVLVVSHSIVDELLGFQFHRGFLACGQRKPRVELDDVLLSAHSDPKWLAAYAVEVQDPENLGSILRTCACLGITDVLLGPGTADPLSRRVLRVSMGAALKLRWCHVANVIESLNRLHQSGVYSVAATLKSGSIDIRSFQCRGPSVVLFGNEANGLSCEIQDSVSDCIRIPMDLGADSLNVSVAAGIILHHIRRIAF